MTGAVLKAIAAVLLAGGLFVGAADGSEGGIMVAQAGIIFGTSPDNMPLGAPGAAPIQPADHASTRLRHEAPNRPKPDTRLRPGRRAQ
jgi:hypothetical protein